MYNFSFLLSGEGAGTTPSPTNYWSLLLIPVLLVLMYFFMIRPQKKQEQRDNAMRDSLAVGDEVTTIGGIIGKVVSIKGETFVLETTRDKTKIRFLKAAVRSVDVKAADIAAAVIAEENAKNAAENADAPTADEKGAKNDTSDKSEAK